MQKYKVYINKECKIVSDNWDGFSEEYILIEAAGGLVYNANNQLLMIFRDNKWDLPKGKLEVGEDIQHCAIREVEEECGVRDLQIVSELQSTFHTYEMNGEAILKKIYWFKMNTKYDGELVPQIKEGITKVQWVDEKDIPQKLESTYQSIKDLLIA